MTLRETARRRAPICLPFFSVRVVKKLFMLTARIRSDVKFCQRSGPGVQAMGEFVAGSRDGSGKSARDRACALSGTREVVKTARRAFSAADRHPGTEELGLLGHDVHKMVKFAIRNPKLEFRNPKQTQNPNFQITKVRRL